MTSWRRLFAPALLLRRQRQRQVMAALGFFFAAGAAFTALAISNLPDGDHEYLYGRAGLVAGLSLILALEFGALLGADRLNPSAAQRNSGNSTSGPTILIVADWSTKMIIGAGLALLAVAPSAISELGEYLAIGRTFEGERLGTLVAAYFASGGAMVGYLFARLRAAEYAERPKLLEDGLQLAMNLPLDPEKWKGLTVSQTRMIEAVVRTPREYLRNRSELHAWARAQFAFGTPTLAEETLKHLLRERKDATVALELEEVSKRINGSGLLLGPSTDSERHEDKPMLPSEAISAMFQALYENPPAGFTRAIELGESFADKTQNAQLWAYLACAYGQQHEYLLSQSDKDTSAIERASSRALFSTQQAVDLDASWRPTLRAFWNPANPGKDDDLVSFFGDPRFAAILEPDTAKTPGSLAQDIREALSRPTGAKYSGAIEVWLTGQSGADVAQKEGRFLVSPNANLRLVVQFSPIGDSKTALPINLEGGEQSLVDFVLQPACSEIAGFSPDSLMVAVPAASASTRPDFSFDAPAHQGTYEIWLQVTQAGRTANVIKLLLEVAEN